VKHATLGDALRLTPDTVALDLASGSGEMLCTWARDHGMWLDLRRWLDHNADDELAGEVRTELATDPGRYARYTREYLGWGVFALMNC
jgi:hypothetical protein